MSQLNHRSARLDVPGFSFGRKTGEYIDVPRIFGGHATPKRSGRAHTLSELSTGVVVSKARKGLLAATRLARQEYNKGRRFRAKQAKKPITKAIPTSPCVRRYLEHAGLPASGFAYDHTPEFFDSSARVAYEVTDGLMPFVTFTSPREALMTMYTLRHFGIAAYIDQIKIPRT